MKRLPCVSLVLILISSLSHASDAFASGSEHDRPPTYSDSGPAIAEIPEPNIPERRLIACAVALRAKYIVPSINGRKAVALFNGDTMTLFSDGGASRYQMPRDPSQDVELKTPYGETGNFTYVPQGKFTRRQLRENALTSPPPPLFESVPQQKSGPEEKKGVSVSGEALPRSEFAALKKLIKEAFEGKVSEIDAGPQAMPWSENKIEREAIAEYAIETSRRKLMKDAFPACSKVDDAEIKAAIESQKKVVDSAIIIPEEKIRSHNAGLLENLGKDLNDRQKAFSRTLERFPAIKARFEKSSRLSSRDVQELRAGLRLDVARRRGYPVEEEVRAGERLNKYIDALVPVEDPKK